MHKKYPVIICGAGIAGIATAYYLATQHKITDILLVDKHAPLSQTTAKSGENYRNWWPRTAMVDFINRSINLMEGLAEQTENAIQMKRQGYVYGTTVDDPTPLVQGLTQRYSTLDVGPIRVHGDLSQTYLASITQPGRVQPQVGADVLLNRELIRQSYPHLSSDVSALVHVRRAGDISVQQLGMHLLTVAREQGVRLLQGEVRSINQPSAGTTSVEIETQDGLIHATTERFVNAAGPFAARLLTMVDVDLPIHTVFQQKIAIQDPLAIVPRHAPFTSYLDEQSLSWSAEEQAFWAAEPDAGWLLDRFPGGLHVRPEGSGDSTWIKLGWAYNREPSAPVWEPPTSEAFPEIMLRGVSTLVPGLQAYIQKIPQPIVHYGGYYVKTPENLPLVGPINCEGMYIVSALAGFGTMAGCAAGELCAAWVADGPLPDYAEALSPVRYEDADYVANLGSLNVEGEL